MSHPPTSNQEHATELAGRCPECDYNLTGAPAERCPWCGWHIDPDLVIREPAGKWNASRIGVVATGFIVCAASMLGVLVFYARAKTLALEEAVLFAGLGAVALGHLALAIICLRKNTRWPLKKNEAAAILRFVAFLSIATGIYGATSLLRTERKPLVVRDATVGGIFEFTMGATLFMLPGLSLLALRAITFAPEAHRTTGRNTRNDREDQTYAPFIVDLCRRLDRQHVVTTPKAAPRKRHPALEAQIQRIWDAASAEARTTGKLLYNGELARLSNWKLHDQTLTLETGTTCYRDFLGTNLTLTDNAQAVTPNHLANPLGISAVVVTADHHVALGRRSHRVIAAPGALHAFGGIVEPNDLDPQGRLDVFHAMTRELKEELALNDDEITELNLVGLVRDLHILQPELLFEANITLTRDQLLQRFTPDLADGEHTAVEFTFDDDESPPHFIRNATAIAPVAQAALLLKGRLAWGEHWYEKHCMMLYGQLPHAPGLSA